MNIKTGIIVVFLSVGCYILSGPKRPKRYFRFLSKVFLNLPTYRMIKDRSYIIIALATILLTSSSFAWPYRRRDVFDNAVDSPGGLVSHLQQLGEALYGLPNNETGSKVANWHEGMSVNPEELGNYAEGDILFPLGMNRNGLKADAARWPNGIIPYMISPYFGKIEFVNIV